MSIPDLFDRTAKAILDGDPRAESLLRLYEAATKWAASR